jgi:hypothetical protein
VELIKKICAICLLLFLPTLAFGWGTLFISGGSDSGGGTTTTTVPATTTTTLPGGGATETFYLCASGGGGAPETDSCTGAFDVDDINTNANWANVDSDDGLIGPNDRIYIKDDDGTFTAQLWIAGLSNYTGISGKPVLFLPYPGDTVTFDISDGSGWSENTTIYIQEDYIEWYCNDQITVKVNDTNSGFGFFLGWGPTGDYVTIDSCIITGDTGTDGQNYGISSDGANYFTYTNNTISNVALGIVIGNGTHESATYGTVSNNNMTGGTRSASCGCNWIADGINCNAGGATYDDYSNVTIEYNTIKSYPDDDIDVYGCSQVTIQYNLIDTGTITDNGSDWGDGNGIKAGGQPWTHDNIVRYNYIKTKGGAGWQGGSAITHNEYEYTYCSGASNGPCDNKTYGNIIENWNGTGIWGTLGGWNITQNTVRTTGSGYAVQLGLVNSSDAATFQNNIVINAGSGGDVILWNYITGTDVITGGYNMYEDDFDLNGYGSSYAGEANDIADDPEFESASDLRLTVGSPAESGGASLSGVYDYCIDTSSTFGAGGSVTLNQNTGNTLGAYCPQ